MSALDECISSYRTCFVYKDSGTVVRQPLNAAMVAESYVFETSFRRGHTFEFAGKASIGHNSLPLVGHSAFAFVKDWRFTIVDGAPLFSTTLSDGTSAHASSIGEACTFADASSRGAFSIIPALLLSSPESGYFRFDNYELEHKTDSDGTSEFFGNSKRGDKSVRIVIDSKRHIFQEVELTERLDEQMDSVNLFKDALKRLEESKDLINASKLRQLLQSPFGEMNRGLRTMYSFNVHELVPGG